MDFVNKKQFEEAIAVLEKALKNGQVIEGKISDHRTQLIMSVMQFQSPYSTESLLSSQIAFVDPFNAAKNRLHDMQAQLKKQKDQATISQKNLEQLEQEEQKLKTLLPSLKE